MKNLAQDIRNVIATLENLNIQATYDNMNRLLGCMQVLNDVISKMEGMDSGSSDSE